jgi:hypothetical protein
MKKIIYSLLAASISFLSLAQTATQPAGSGTTSDPYQISTLNNLYWLCENEGQWDKSYIQTADINASTTSTWYSGQGFKPLGWIVSQSNAIVFNGTYNGNGHTISNLTINRPSNTTFGTAMFGALAYGTVKNLHLTNVSIVGKNQTGGLVGICYECVVENSSSSGNVQGNETVGGFVGEVAIGTIKNSSSSCSVLATLDRAGGFVGKNDETGTVLNCFSTGNVSCSNTNDGTAGGFVGKNNGTIKYSYSTGSVSAAEEVGGFVGKNGDEESLNALVDSCYSTGSISFIETTIYARMGGFVGVNFFGVIRNSYSIGNVNASTSYTNQSGGFVGSNTAGTIQKCYSLGNVNGFDCLGGFVGANYASNDNVSSLIENCYSRGSAQGTQNNIGGFVGCNQKSNIFKSYSTGSAQGSSSVGGFAGGVSDNSYIGNSYWDTQTSGLTLDVGYADNSDIYIYGRNSTQMKTQSTFTGSGWDFVGESANGTEDIWSIVSTVNDGYPSLRTAVVASSKSNFSNVNVKTEILIYPNPAFDFLRIKSEHSISSIKLFDLLGKLQLETNLTEINTESLPKGLYLLKVETSKGVFDRKVSIK